MIMKRQLSTDGNFEIKILDLHWITGIDNSTDLCAHGHVFVKIGDEVVADKNSLDVTVSTTALYLMRTLQENHPEDKYASQLLPCCGFVMSANDEGDRVDIHGCPSGIDWTIVHTDENKITHILDSGKEITIDKDAYRKIVFDFADQVEHFYKTSLPRTIPVDDFDKKGYAAFWKEWRTLRGE